MGGDVFPRQAPRTRVSHAEVAIWEALRRGLPTGWRAWHSLRLRAGGRWEGEGDFVIADPDRGLLVLEVKGGPIELRDGRWCQNGRELDRAPRQQALDFIKKLIGALRDRGVETPAYGVACAFPDVEFSDGLGPRAADLADLVLGPRQLQWLERALPPLLARACPDHPAPKNRRWLTVLHELWGETWVPSLSLSDEVQDGEGTRPTCPLPVLHRRARSGGGAKLRQAPKCRQGRASRAGPPVRDGVAGHRGTLRPDGRPDVLGDRVAGRRM